MHVSQLESMESMIIFELWVVSLCVYAMWMAYCSALVSLSGKILGAIMRCRTIYMYIYTQRNTHITIKITLYAPMNAQRYALSVLL